ncbi:LOW QUALITY PROTEIN: kunitz trypsin inhibitor 5-like [Salvia miltiorrhiza]|uniref:LOW QUALITY PROTEIN: kunitz trypsin inhibitor 5-like n=1 Tax=Salvia miltiorrhiza TaxID=226208 RepID=UPI0025ACBF74|nr:LOW QUALITY PROTEIN: kunitz trypsin inhibitor 5-like [Salvia miltiorrhiza]
MNTTHLSLCCILLSILISTATAAPPPVLDIEGKQLRAGADYYILPVVRGRGGGLTLAATRNETCPLDVVQERLEVKNGLPLSFRPTNGKKGVVRLSTDHNIKFSAASICVQSTVWKLHFDESIQKYTITTGGVEGNPGGQTLSNWFKIEKYDDDYKLVFCPTVCNYCKVICKDVGILVEEDGLRRLTLTDTAPFKLFFKRA